MIFSRRFSLTCQICALVFCLGVAQLAMASEYRETSDFADVANRVNEYSSQYTSQDVLLVVDIDNTLLAMNHDLGSDQWFEWQNFLLANEPESPLLVAKNFGELLETQGLLFSLGKMHPPQEDLPQIIAALQTSGVRTLVLTSRGYGFRAATERELAASGYDFASSAIPTAVETPYAFQPYDLHNIEGAGITDDDARIYSLKKPRAVSFANGIYMTAGQHKGVMLLTLLGRSDHHFRAIVFADDHPRHVNRVYDAITRRGIEITAFHYQREETNVRRFQYGNKSESVRRWRQLEETLQAVSD